MLKRINIIFWIVLGLLFLWDPVFNTEVFVDFVPEEYHRHIPAEASLTTVVFGGCVAALMWFADTVGTDYYTVNIWIFVLIWPALLSHLLIEKMQRR